ncbi:L-2-amino-thiazoline-4-carboxylic acid hydrolase [Acidisoma silvae]|uniref:L-2-amino-thiazoline-4-carboxylic acid hydrolase n=1 Tax=Acidisoma silvae TaxID=2802396 RepID=A0A964E0X7_9PROT|nr:L-2-amino-thiazoline-4-carboxylic acid hydrolase [Acidisoma silvae]MCB8877995.1 L-2-amino-thiazoline-4-carboxylic acid hydrolase [Acidisoma silvae]
MDRIGDDKAADTGAGEMGILQRRKIEAEIIAPIYRTMCDEIGEARAQDILDRAIRQAAIEAGQGFAAKTPGGTSLQTFRELLELWTREDALRIEVIAETEAALHFNVQRCRYAESYRAMGLGEIGHLLSCNRDAAFCIGYDPRLKLTRTQTIMEGASHCDFRYEFLKEPTTDQS